MYTSRVEFFFPKLLTYRSWSIHLQLFLVYLYLFIYLYVIAWFIPSPSSWTTRFVCFFVLISLQMLSQCWTRWSGKMEKRCLVGAWKCCPLGWRPREQVKGDWRRRPPSMWRPLEWALSHWFTTRHVICQYTRSVVLLSFSSALCTFIRSIIISLRFKRKRKKSPCRP